MKHLFSVWMLLCIVATVSSQDSDAHATGRTNLKAMGCYVFVFSEPLESYDHVKTINLPASFFNNVDNELEWLIKRARRKHPYFNGIVINSHDHKKAELIKFRDIEISSNGYRIGDKAVFKAGNDIRIGTIREVNPTRGVGTFAYINIYGEEKAIERKLKHFTPISEEEYNKQLAIHMEKVAQYKYDVGEHATWTLNKKLYFGTIKLLDDKSHNATIEHLDIFGDKKTRKVPYLDITIIDEEQHNKLLSEWTIKMAQYQFKEGETVQWVVSHLINGNKTREGQIIKLYDKTKQADVEYKSEDGTEKVARVPYLQLIKRKA